jgi:hypothetical protein
LQVKPVFDKLGISLKWSDEYWSDDITLHTIVLNGKEYDPFRGNPNDKKIWAIAFENMLIGNFASNDFYMAQW